MSRNTETIRKAVEARGYTDVRVWWESLTGHDGVYEGGYYVAHADDPAGESIAQDIDEALNSIPVLYPMRRGSLTTQAQAQQAPGGDRGMDAVERRVRAFEHLNDPNRPDNMDARKALVERMQRGEISLAEAQAELAALKRLR